MNLPEYSLRSAKVIWFFLAVLLAGGALGFATLGKKEDAVFVIKSASLVCSYPGATPQQVEELVTEPIEREVQSMRRVHKITSESYYGLSKIQVELDPATPAAEIPQLWDELRRKVLNVQPRLPAGASAVTVADDFGDVYGIYYGLSVDGGFTWSELRDWAQRLKTALVTVDGVQKVALLRRTDARGERLCQHGDAGQFRHPSRNHRRGPSASRIPSSTAARSRPERSRYRFWRTGPTRTLDDLSRPAADLLFGQTVPPGRHRPRRAGLRRAAADDDARRTAAAPWASASRPRRASTW